MSYKPYLTDTNGQPAYEGTQVFRYKPDETNLEYGILKLTPAEDENEGLYKWSVDWEDNGMEYWNGLLPLWTGNKPEPPPEYNEDNFEDAPE